MVNKMLKNLGRMFLFCMAGALLAHEDDGWRPSALRSGDVLQISVFRVEEFSRTVRIEEDGKFNYPMCGSIQAAGRTPRELAQELTRLLSSQIANPYVDVTVTTCGPRTVYILGELKSGSMSVELPIFERMSALQVISAAGGFTENADLSRVAVLRRVKGEKIPRRFPIDVSSLYTSNGSGAELKLLPEDTLIVPKAQPVYVSGLVGDPGVYQIDTQRPPLCSEFMVRAGGLSMGADPSDIRIVRNNNTAERNVIYSSLRIMPDGNYEKDIPILPGDYILVGRAAQIYVVGEVEKPGPLELLPNQKITASQAVAMVGGFTALAKQGGLILIRGKERRTVDLRKLYNKPDNLQRDIELQFGDILFVPESFW